MPKDERALFLLMILSMVLGTAMMIFAACYDPKLPPSPAARDASAE